MVEFQAEQLGGLAAIAAAGTVDATAAERAASIFSFFCWASFVDMLVLRAFRAGERHCGGGRRIRSARTSQQGRQDFGERWRRESVGSRRSVSPGHETDMMDNH